MAGNQVRFRLGQLRPFQGADHRSRAQLCQLSCRDSGTDHIGLPTGPGNLTVGTSQGLAVDSAGSVYVAGNTYSIDFPTKNPYQSAPPAKRLAGAPSLPGIWPSAFVTKFSPDGSSLVYSTYLGGNGYDYIYAIAVDSKWQCLRDRSDKLDQFPGNRRSVPDSLRPGSQQYRAVRRGGKLQFRQRFRICDQAESHRNGPCLLHISGRIRLRVRKCHCRG